MADEATRIVLNIDANLNQINKKLARLTGDSDKQFKKITFNANSFEKKFQKSMRDTAAAVSVMHGPLGGVASRVTAIGSIVGNTSLAMAGFLGTTAAMTFGMHKAVQAFIAFETQQFTTEAVIKATGAAAGKTGKDIEDLARNVALGTLASRQEARAAATQLLTFKSIAGDNFDRTLTAAQDLAASGFGTLTSSTVQLAKALEDPVQGLSALRRVGVSFTPVQRNMIKNFMDMGQVAEAQNVILKAVEEQVGGAGVAAGKGLAGAYDTLSENTGILLERWGRQITEGLRLKEILSGIAEEIGDINAAAEMGIGPIDRFMLRLQGVDIDQALKMRNSPLHKAMSNAFQLPVDSPDTSVRDTENLRAFIAAEKERARMTRDQITAEKDAEAIMRRAREEGIYLTKEQAVNQANLNMMIAGQVEAHEKFAQVRMGVHDQIRMRELEAEALMAVAGSASEYANAIEFARMKARLLNEAEKEGITITPAYRAEIERLATAYSESGKAAEDALKNIEAQTQFSGEVASTIQSSFTSLFSAIVEGGKSAGDVVADLGKKLAGMAAQEATFRLLGAVLPGVFGAGGFLNLRAAANGGVFSGPGINEYSGKVVDKPTIFPFAKGAGLMGEAGPEAVLPLTRIGGKLGVRAQGGGGGTEINIINQAPVEISTEKQTDASGREINNIVIREVNKGLAQGRVDPGMGRFGARPRPVRRG